MNRRLEDCLRTIYDLEGERRRIPTKEVASRLGIPASSSTEILKRTAEKRLVNYVPYSGVILTRKGIIYSMRIKRRYELAKRFLQSLLDIEPKRAEREADRLEHAMSDNVAEAISRIIGQNNLETVTVTVRSDVEPLCRALSSPPTYSSSSQR
jgi:DtxR family Mn-dependent transcriptional regulator